MTLLPLRLCNPVQDLPDQGNNRGQSDQENGSPANLREAALNPAAADLVARLIARELREPTPALDELVAQVMSPVRHSLERVIAALLGDVDEPQLRGQCTNFVLALCVMHEQGQEILRRFGYPVPRTEAALIPLADAITEFALGGIERIRGSGA